MTPELSLALRQNACRRALLYGAEDSPAARARYFRELEAIDLLAGHQSPFGALGRKA